MHRNSKIFKFIGIFVEAKNVVIFTYFLPLLLSQYPSFVPNTIETRLTSDAVRNLPVDEDIVYGSSAGNQGSPQVSWRKGIQSLDSNYRVILFNGGNDKVSQHLGAAS